MPRIGIISDVHGNLEALEAVLNAVQADDVEHVIHLGDLVGYNANPRECLHLVQERRITSVLGNHDLAILEPDTQMASISSHIRPFIILNANSVSTTNVFSRVYPARIYYLGPIFSAMGLQRV